MVKQALLLLAAGRSKRFGGETPKQYALLDDHSVLWHTLVSLGSNKDIHQICIVINPDDVHLFEVTKSQLPYGIVNKMLTPVSGGSERQQSVLNGLIKLNETSNPPDSVFIHDSARPFVSKESIKLLGNALKKSVAAILALPISDTVKRSQLRPDSSNNNLEFIDSTVDRTNLWRAQTPQAFRFKDILSAHLSVINKLFTDDAAIAEDVGLSVLLVQGDERNFKITTRQDLELAQEYLNMKKTNYSIHASETRVGSGFDVHKFGPGDSLMICGIQVPHEYGVLSHSDGDVGIHSLVDAMLGTIGDGDIGSHFPPEDATLLGAPSDQFLSYAYDLLKSKGVTLINADITIIAERPKIGPYREKMRSRIAEILDEPIDRFSIKATTTEKIGFIGRNEGIAAQAIISVNLE